MIDSTPQADFGTPEVSVFGHKTSSSGHPDRRERRKSDIALIAGVDMVFPVIGIQGKR